MMDPMMGDEKMPMEDEEMGAAPMAPKRGSFQNMLEGIMPSPAELGDLLGDSGPGFHDASEQAPPGLLGDGNFDPEPMGSGPAAGDYTGQAPYDPELVKQDIRALLAQRAQERSAASDEFQGRALEE